MKKLMKLFWVIPMVLIVFLLGNSCKKDSGGSGYNCETTTIAGENVQACCNSSNCYYEWNGQKYYCDGLDCTDAAQRLVNDILGKSSPIDDETRLEYINKLLNR